MPFLIRKANYQDLALQIQKCIYTSFFFCQLVIRKVDFTYFSIYNLKCETVFGKDGKNQVSCGKEQHTQQVLVTGVWGKTFIGPAKLCQDVESPRGGIRSVKNRNTDLVNFLLLKKNCLHQANITCWPIFYIKGIPVDSCSNPTAFPSTKLQVFVRMILWLSLVS